MRKPGVMFALVLVLGAAVCAGDRVDAATQGDGAAVETRQDPAPAVATIGVPAPAPVSPTGPSSFAMGGVSLAALGLARRRRRRFLAEHAAL